jgi:hypothetical protein
MSCAGSYHETVKDGGRGKEIRDTLNIYFSYVPSEDEEIETPFGPLCCPAGMERWRYWCRKTPYLHYPEVKFGEPIPEEVFAEQNIYYQGFDEAIGNQILAISYLCYISWTESGLPIPCRVLTVPEPGGKARIVTTGPFWLNTLQQSVAHTMKSVLKYHPSCRSSLQKTDQAWQAMYLFSNKQYPEDFECLSSDLSEATDHLPKRVAECLLSGFARGIGLRSKLLEISIDLISRNREFVLPDDVSLKQARGVMMGEPLTKVVLTLLNLFVEESAMREYLEVTGGSDYKSPPWRSYHIGGDDHLGVGPPKYLRYITKNHIKCGSKISAGKHGQSKTVVKYCEKVIDVRNLLSKPFDVRTINDSTESYEASPFIDSIKVRLLSPLTKAFDVSADRNVAIGKGLSLGRTLKWMNVDHFPTKWLRMVRDRFFQRMGSLLPDRTSGLYWQLFLPVYWGGLNLYIEEELPTVYAKVPQLTKSIMEDYISEGSLSEPGRCLQKLLSNFSYRGFRLNESEKSLMRDHVENVIKLSLPSSTWRQLVTEFNPEGEHSAQSLIHVIHEQGWMNEDEIYDQLLRPILFKEILLGQEKPSPYNTERLKNRYAKLWDRFYKGDSSLTFEHFVNVLRAKPQGLYYKVTYPEEIHFISDRGYTYKSALDDALNGMPVLRTSFPFI